MMFAASGVIAAVPSQGHCIQVEILLSGLWDPSSGNLFAEEGDQQRFWKITRKFVEQVSSTCCAGQVKAVSVTLCTRPEGPLQHWQSRAVMHGLCTCSCTPTSELQPCSQMSGRMLRLA